MFLTTQYIYKQKCDRYLLVSYLIINSGLDVISDDLIRETMSVGDCEGLNILIKNKDIGKMARGDKVNYNCLFDWVEGEDLAVHPVVSTLFKSIVLIEEKGKPYFAFNSNIDYLNFKKFKKLVSINKYLYVQENGYINEIISKLKSKKLLQEVKRGLGNKIPNVSIGSVGPASKIFVYQKNETDKFILSNKLNIHFEDVFDSNFDYKNNIIDSIWSKVSQNELIKFYIEKETILTEADLKKELNTSLLKILK